MDRKIAKYILDRTFLEIDSEYSLGILSGKAIAYTTMGFITLKELDFLIRAAHAWYYDIGRWND